MENLRGCTDCAKRTKKLYGKEDVQRRPGLILEGEAVCESCATKRKMERTEIKRRPYDAPR